MQLTCPLKYMRKKLTKQCTVVLKYLVIPLHCAVHPYCAKFCAYCNLCAHKNTAASSLPLS